MVPKMLLYSEEWAHYPRRILIYLRERQLLADIMTFVPVKFEEGKGYVALDGYPPKPAGSIPILAIPTSPTSPGKEVRYTYIKQSLAILTYLEDLSETPGSDFYTPGKPSMRGRTALEKARVAELLSMIDECSTLFRYWCYSGCHLNPEPNIETAKFMKENLVGSLGTLNSYFLDRDLEFLSKPPSHAGTEREGEQPGFMEYVTIADCALFAFFQYANGMFGRDLSAEKGLEKLREFWERFGRRESARLETEYDREMQKEAMVWYEGAA